MLMISKISKPGLLASPNLISAILRALGKMVSGRECAVESGSPFPRINSPGHGDPVACFPVPSYGPNGGLLRFLLLAHHRESAVLAFLRHRTFWPLGFLMCLGRLRQILSLPRQTLTGATLIISVLLTVLWHHTKGSC